MSTVLIYKNFHAAGSVLVPPQLPVVSPGEPRLSFSCGVYYIAHITFDCNRHSTRWLLGSYPPHLRSPPNRLHTALYQISSHWKPFYSLSAAVRRNAAIAHQVRWTESERRSYIWGNVLHLLGTCRWSILEGIWGRRRDDRAITWEIQTGFDRQDKLWGRWLILRLLSPFHFGLEPVVQSAML